MLGFKDTRANHTARQTRLHKTDRCKHRNQLISATPKPWKSSKGYGSSSGQVTTPGRNYGRHIDNAVHENMLHLNKTNKTYRCQLDDEEVDMDILSERARCDYAWNGDAAPRQPVEVDLLSIARPARARKNKSELLIRPQVALQLGQYSSCIAEHSRATQLYASPALERVANNSVADVSDTQSNITGTDFSFDFGRGDDFGPWSSECCWAHGEGDCCNFMPDVNDSSPSPETQLSESASNFALGNETTATSSIELEPLFTELEYTHEELRIVPRRIFSPAPLSPVSDDDDAESTGWDDLAFSEAESDVEWVDLNDDVSWDNITSSAQVMKLEAT